MELTERRDHMNRQHQDNMRDSVRHEQGASRWLAHPRARGRGGTGGSEGRTASTFLTDLEQEISAPVAARFKPEQRESRLRKNRACY